MTSVYPTRCAVGTSGLRCKSLFHLYWLHAAKHEDMLKLKQSCRNLETFVRSDFASLSSFLFVCMAPAEQNLNSDPWAHGHQNREAEIEARISRVKFPTAPHHCRSCRASCERSGPLITAAPMDARDTTLSIFCSTEVPFPLFGMPK